MRTKIEIDDEVLKQAIELSGIEDPNKLVEVGLKALIAREAARRLAALGGTMPRLKHIPRRRLKP